MKFKDYYSALGVERDATAAEIKQAYRKLAHKYHPDVSKDPDGEEKFKEVAEAYATLKDQEKRDAYNALGRHQQGENVQPPQDWQQTFNDSDAGFGDVDMADILAAFAASRHAGGQPHQRRPSHGQDYEVKAPITLEQIYAGGEIDVNLNLPEYDQQGLNHRVPRTFRIKVPKGAEDGQRLRLPGKGGQGSNGGKNGDLYVSMVLIPHPFYRVSEKDLYIDLPLTPWEAVLGASVQVPTLGGTVELTVPPRPRQTDNFAWHGGASLPPTEKMAICLQLSGSKCRSPRHRLKKPCLPSLLPNPVLIPGHISNQEVSRAYSYSGSGVAQ